jgi:hypothetical protein
MMTSGNLWLEITIAGFPYLLSFFFLVLSATGVKDLKAVTPDKDYLPYISVGVVAASYVIGVLTHRLTQIVVPPLMGFLERRLRLSNLANPQDPETLARNMARVWQRGSERLNKEIDFQFSLVALLRSLVLSLPILGLCISAWLSQARYSGLWIPVVTSLALASACLVVYRKQRLQVIRLRTAAFSELDK